MKKNSIIQDSLPEFRTLVQKSDLKNYVTTRIKLLAPDLIGQISQKRLVKTLTYLEGYYNGVQMYLQPPIVLSELRSFLLSEGLTYMYNMIKE